MPLLTKSDLLSKVSKASGYFAEANIRKFAADELLNEKRAADRLTKTYDIFLSHSSEDAIYIKALRDYLVEAGYTVYVDWIEDPQLNRANVTKETAGLLRQRMNCCRCLLYATSDAARKSVWMPWELGYVDARTKSRVAIAPIVDDDAASKEFKGQEYLGLYPYLDRTSGRLYVHDASGIWVQFAEWLNGANPLKHS
jgi:hypothetical protein